MVFTVKRHIEPEGTTLSYDDLIERLRKTTAPSRELDGELFKAVEEKPGDVWTREIDDSVWHRRDPKDHVAFDPPPHYTASIDAALMLVPKLTWIKIDTGTQSGGHNFEWPIVACGNQKTGKRTWKGQAATLALALCIAALKARNYANS